jgi:hypothetical protein
MVGNQQLSSQNFRWWTGQIESEAHEQNINATKFESKDDIPGWGARYKVRIIGEHPQKKEGPSGVKEEHLETCDVMYPVTAGSGHCSSFQTAMLMKGTFVIGFCRDGDERSEYVIIGCLGNQDQTDLKSKPDPKKGFTPHSAFTDKKRVPEYAKPPGGGSGGGAAGGSNKPREANSQNATGHKNKADEDQQKDGKEAIDLGAPRKCGGTELRGIQLALRKLILKLEFINKKLNEWSSAALGVLGDIQSALENACELAAEYIAGKVKNIIEEIRKYVLDLIQKTTKKAHNKVFPPDRPKVKKIQDKVWEVISCIFNKLIDALLGMIKGFLMNICKGSMVTAPSCAATNMMSDFLSQLLGQLIGVIQAALKPLFAILGGAASLAGSILGLILKLIGFFKCEVNQDCPDIVEWSIWDGPGTVPGGQLKMDIESIFASVKQTGKDIGDSLDPENFSFKVDLKGSEKKNGCNTGPKKCGPPKVEFYGGGGSGARGNVIVSKSGDIMGVDMVSRGSGYTKAPIGSIVDDCGKGVGAVIQPLLEFDGGGDGGVGSVVVIDPGYGYLTYPSGELGGDGRVWAKPNQTIVRRIGDEDEPTFWDIPRYPGETITVDKGDEVQVPSDVVTECGELIPANVPYIVQIPCKFRAPDREEDANQDLLDLEQTSDDPIYPVLLYICDFQIIDQGINYSEGDTITITPNNGAIVEPVFGPFGTLEKINIIDGGLGFIERPEIAIQTETGYNAEIVPVFCTKRIEDVDDGVDLGTVTVIQVIDCVGKI